MEKKIVSFIHNIPIRIALPEDIGLDSVPDKIRRKSKKDGFYINILVLGRRGLGATTLINSLFASDLINKERADDVLRTFKNEIYENEICLKISITTYHGDNIEEVLKFLDSRNAEYFESEQGLTRPKLDPRIHLALFLLPNDTITGDEINMMKEVSHKCNLVPIISKADSFTRDETEIYKSKVNELLVENKINVFRPEIYKEDDSEMDQETTEILHRYPFAVFASTDAHEFNGERKFGRLYPWGFLDIENEDTNDFVFLRKLIVSNHLDDLISHTDVVFYNNYRKKHLESERVDEILKKKRIERIKDEMEKICEERKRLSREKIKTDIMKIEDDVAELNVEVDVENNFLDSKVESTIQPNTDE